MPSTFPDSLDNDAGLIRVIGTDPLIPAQHNNHTDALEAIEMAIGVMDSTLGGTLPSAFPAPLAHRLGIGTIQGANPRYPWGTPDANSYYGVYSALPAGWVLDGLATLDPIPDPQYARLGVAASVGVAALTMPVAPAGAWALIARLASAFTEPGQAVEIGYSSTAGTDVTGIRIDAGGSVQHLVDGGGGIDSFALYQLGFASSPVYYQVAYDGANYDVGVSDDGRRWHWIVKSLAHAAPNNLVVNVIAATVNPFWVGVDFIAQGIGRVGAL